tara:strand:+ start:5887 stop:6234 length:348 start_codon:yes stop_codon:yes gene_type:complete
MNMMKKLPRSLVLDVLAILVALFLSTTIYCWVIMTSESGSLLPEIESLALATEIPTEIPTQVPLTTSQTISIIGCEKLKIMYDKAYVEAIDPQLAPDLDWAGIDAVFYDKFKECL